MPDEKMKKSTVTCGGALLRQWLEEGQGIRLHSLCITWGGEDFFGGYKNFQDEIGGGLEIFNWFIGGCQISPWSLLTL